MKLQESFKRERILKNFSHFFQHNLSGVEEMGKASLFTKILLLKATLA